MRDPVDTNEMRALCFSCGFYGKNPVPVGSRAMPADMIQRP